MSVTVQRAPTTAEVDADPSMQPQWDALDALQEGTVQESTVQESTDRGGTAVGGWLAGAFQEMGLDTDAGGPEVKLSKYSKMLPPPGSGLYVWGSTAVRKTDQGWAYAGQSDLNIAMEDIESLVDTYTRDIVNITFTPVEGTPFYRVGLIIPDVDDPALAFENNAGLQLLDQLVRAPEGFLYQVGEFSGQVKPASNRMESDKIRWGDLNQDKNRLSNYSTTQRLLDYQGQKLQPDSSTMLPVANDGKTVFDGVTTLHPETIWTENGEPKPRSAVVFHELWENYERTHNQEPYDYPLFHPRIREGENYPGTNTPATDAQRRKGGKPRLAGALEQVYDPSRDGAHDKAVNAEDRFWNKSSVPGGADLMKGG